MTGFDGIEEGRYVTPPLTTVMQPLAALGSATVDALLELIDGGTPQDRVLACTPVIRQSCGCPPKRSYDAALTTPPESATPEEKKAIEDIAAFARRGDADGFIARFDRALAATTLEGGALGKWNDYLSVVRHMAAGGGPAADGTAGDATPGGPAALFEFARVMVGEAESRLQAARRVAAEKRLATLRTISASLPGALDAR